MAAFSISSEDQVYASASLVRRASAVQEDDSRFKQIQHLLAGPVGEQIISNIDYQQLLSKILTLISQLLDKGEDMIFEDKLIIENALSLLVGCILHKVELLGELYNFKSGSIPSCDEFVLTGLLYCSQERIREEFKQTLGCLARKVTLNSMPKDKNLQPPMFYLLRLLSSNFSLISDYQCKQYFELFCDLIDLYFIMHTLVGSSENSHIFDAESLLSTIIDYIKDYNRQARNKGNSTQLLQMQSSTSR